jgi:hypothetical protein
MNRRRPLVAIGLGVSVLMLSACAGPKAPFDVGTQALPIDLILGEHEAVVEAPVGPISIVAPRQLAPFVPLDTAPSASSTTPSLAVPQVPLEPCPEFDPLAPVSSTGVTVEARPQDATYAYRARTSDTVGDLTSKFTGDSSWKVTAGPLDAATGIFEFTTEVTIGEGDAAVTSTRIFRVLTKPLAGENTPAADPTTTDPNFQVIDQYNLTAPLVGAPTLPRALPNLGRYGLPGIYLVSQTGGDDLFTPTVPIPLLQMPAAPTSFTGVGSDGERVMSFLSTVKAISSPVNACGKKLEAIEVELTDGRLAGLLDNGKAYSIEFTEKLYFGLQFGGLPLRDEGKVTGVGAAVEGAGAIERTFDFTVNTQPKFAKA